MKKILALPVTARFAIALALSFLIVWGLIAAGAINDYIFTVIVTVCVNIILACGLNLVTGFTGQFSLGHAGFMSIGAYVCAFITMRLNSVGGFFLGLFAGACIAALAGFLIGLPILRLKGDYLAIATLGMSEIIRNVFTNIEVTNGAAGLNGIPQYINWPYLFAATAVTVLIISLLIHSTHGRAMIAIREDETAAESVGVNTTRYKVAAFTIGAFFAGLAGAVYASFFYFIKPDLFGFQRSVDILVVVVFGGLGSISGSIIASILLVLLSTLLQSVTELRMVIYALLLIATMIFRPQGIMGSKELSYALFRRTVSNIGGIFRKDKKEREN
jgi:branched-chain amino acid transport system permease protein